MIERAKQPYKDMNYLMHNPKQKKKNTETPCGGEPWSCEA